MLQGVSSREVATDKSRAPLGPDSQVRQALHDKDLGQGALRANLQASLVSAVVRTGVRPPVSDSRKTVRARSRRRSPSGATISKMRLWVSMTSGPPRLPCSGVLSGPLLPLGLSGPLLLLPQPGLSCSARSVTMLITAVHNIAHVIKFRHSLTKCTSNNLR